MLGVEGLGFRDKGCGLRVQGSEIRVGSLGIEGIGIRVEG